MLRFVRRSNFQGFDRRFPSTSWEAERLCTGPIATRAIVAIAALAGAAARSSRSGGAVGREFPDLRRGPVARERQRVHPPAVHAVLQPGDAGERGQVGERGRDDANRGHALGESRHDLQLRPDQRLPVQLPRAGLGQPAADVDGGAAGRGAAGGDPQVVRGRRGALSRTSSGSRSSTSRCTIRPTARRPSTRATTAAPAATTRGRSAGPTGPTARGGTGSSTPSGWRSSTSRTRS